MKSRRISERKEYYCRKCMESKQEVDFYVTSDSFLDTNGKLSVCKSCCSEIYKSFLNTELDIKKAIQKTCKTLNIAFVSDVANATIEEIEQNKNVDVVFGVYKKRLSAYFKLKRDIPETYEDSNVTGVKFNEKDEKEILENEGVEFSDYLKTTWGSGLSISDYNFLESALSQWKKTHKCDTTSELILMQEICHLQLGIRKAREEGKETKAMVKALQDLIKTSNLSPAQANMSNASRGNEIFGMWIKDIEQKEPAEWWNENRNAFVDVDNLQQYFEDFVTRPIKNFITRSKDFSIKSNGNNVEFEIKEQEEEFEDG